MSKLNGELPRVTTEIGASPCRLKLSPYVDGFRRAIDVVERSDESNEDAENQLCLASRSAYFVFFDWAVLHEEIDPWAKEELTKLFERALQCMKIPLYSDSVRSRFTDLKNVCKRVSEGREADSLTSIPNSTRY
jgi:hypothetical protein